MISRREFVQGSMALTIMPTLKINKKEYSKNQKEKWKLGITNLDKALKGGIPVKPYPSSMIMINTTDNNDFIDALDNTIPYQQPVENQYPVHIQEYYPRNIYENFTRNPRYFIFTGEKENSIYGYPVPYQHNLLSVFNGEIGRNKEIIIYFDSFYEHTTEYNPEYIGYTPEYIVRNIDYPYDYASVITNGTKKNTFNWKLMKITDRSEPMSRNKPMLVTPMGKKCEIVMTSDQSKVIDLNLKINDKRKLEEI